MVWNPGPTGPCHLAAAGGELEERGRQLRRWIAHSGGAFRSGAPVCRQLLAGGEALGRQEEGRVTERPSSNRIEHAYQALLPLFDHLPEDRRRLWRYYRLWPHLAFDVYPDQVDFMQFLPVSPTETVIREIAYGRHDARREVRA